MFPDVNEVFTTDGERDFYYFIKEVAQPDADFLCWYTPDVGGLEPDFVLFSRDVGVVVLEVKDWNLGQIAALNTSVAKVKIGTRMKTLKNPAAQAKGYLYQLKSRLEKDQKLVSSDPVHKGKSKVPISHGVVFPNIFRADFKKKGFDRVIPLDKIFFLDDIDPSSLLRGHGGAAFRTAMAERFPPLFRFELSARELDHLRQLLFPEVQVRLPARGQSPDYARFENRVRHLDHRQEAAARHYGGGHRIIAGPSGCGKTLVLVHRAALLTKYDPEIQRVLFVCYNVTLVNYIKRLLAELGVPLGEAGVEVLPFFELCSKVLGEKIGHEGLDQEIYDLAVSEAMDRVAESGLRYDAILVDEGQDFSDEMYRLLVALLNRSTDNLTIALDENQSIYDRQHTWRKLGISARGRVHKLKHIYRNTAQIAALGRALANAYDLSTRDEESQLPLFEIEDSISGPAAEFLSCETLSACVEQVAKRSAEFVHANKYSPSEIAVLYTKRHPENDESTPLPRAITNALAAQGLLASWTTENVTGKRHFDITTEKINVSTIHSAKGMDWGCVFLLGLDHLDGSRWSNEQISHLAYVGLTRARYQLIVPYLRETRLLRKLRGQAG